MISQVNCSSLDASAFPGARPKALEKRLKKLHRDLKLMWNPEGYWEVWHLNRKGAWYCFHKHSRFRGEYLPADNRLYDIVCERANFTEHGQSVIRRLKESASAQNDAQLDIGNVKGDKMKWVGNAKKDSNPIYYT